MTADTKPPCPKCKGFGKVPGSDGISDPLTWSWRVCPDCHGTGKQPAPCEVTSDERHQTP